MALTSRERVLTALALHEPDRIPIFDSIFCRDIYEDALGYRPEYYNSEDAVRAAAALGLDAAVVVWGGYPGIEPEGVHTKEFESEWGCTYGRTEAGWPGAHSLRFGIKRRSDLQHFRPPDPGAPGRMDSLKRAAEIRAQSDIALISAVRGPFAHAAWHFIGMVETCMALYDDPALLHVAFRMITDFNVEICRLMAGIGVDVVVITEDLGSNTGPLISPMHYREMMLPYLQEIVTHIRSLGMTPVLHSDGHIWSFLNDLVGTGIAGLNPLQRSAGMSLRRAKEEFGERVCLIGNVDNVKSLSEGTPHQVEQEVKECIKMAGLGGGYILSSDHSFHEGVLVANVLALVDAGRKWGGYPLRWVGVD